MSPSTTTVSVSDVAVSLEPGSSTEHVLVLSTPQGTLRVQGTVAQLRAAAQTGLGLPIPSLPVATSHAAPADDARLAAIEATLARLTEIADRAQRRGLI